MLVLMLTTMVASAAWVTPTESDQSSVAATNLTAETTWNGAGMRYVNRHNYEMDSDSLDPSVKATMWLSEVGPVNTAWVAFGFETAVTIDRIIAWNFNDWRLLTAGIQDFRILYTTDTTSPLKDRSWIDAGTSTMNIGTGSDYSLPNTTIDSATQLPGLDGVELTGLRLEVISTHGLSQAGLSEIHFEGEVVPEPATMGLLAVGGLAMLRSRRRRNNK